MIMLHGLEYRKIFLLLNIADFCIFLLHINIHWHGFKRAIFDRFGFPFFSNTTRLSICFNTYVCYPICISIFMFSLSSLIMMHLPCLLDNFFWWMLYRVISRSLTLDKTLGNKFLSACEFFTITTLFFI